MRYLFEDSTLDTERRELHRGAVAVSITPQVFDLLDYLIRNRERVVSKDDLISAVWSGRVVSDAALTTRLNAARSAIGDSGEEQRLIKTLPRKGFRSIGTVREVNQPPGAAAILSRDIELTEVPFPVPEKPSIGAWTASSKRPSSIKAIPIPANTACSTGSTGLMRTACSKLRIASSGNPAIL